ncbi:NAD(P)-binding domain-containing protein [Cupriavidus oxalaticus]|uniref:NAD(P)-binding domain-containing protein n=1 Tax=Cupriavidus oxalaticus TaxID=96344 RepID=UPI00403438FA
MNIAIIGLGEVGRCYANALATIPGTTFQFCDTHLSQAGRDLADKFGVPVQGEVGPWLAEADWVLSCVFGAASLDVAGQCFDYMKLGAQYADLTTASPADKRVAAVRAKSKGIEYVDVAVMGAISLAWARTPLLCAATEGAEEFASLIRQAGGNVRVVEDGAAGDAISLKVLRSVFTKGMEALAVELLMAAEKQGVREKLYAVLKDIDESPLADFINMLVRTHTIHAKRRTHEVAEAQKELQGSGLTSLVLPGVEARFKNTAAAIDANPVGEDPSLEDALKWLLKQAT